MLQAPPHRAAEICPNVSKQAVRPSIRHWKSAWILTQETQQVSLNTAGCGRSSRKGTVETANHVASECKKLAASPFVRSRAQLERLQHAAGSLSSKPLQQLILAGIAYHHAAMEPEERECVEGLFKAMDILVRGRNVSLVNTNGCLG